MWLNGTCNSTLVSRIRFISLVGAEGKRTVAEQALELGRLAISSGIDGMVTSAHEAKVLRDAFPAAILVTPGIRMPEGDVGDQKRVATPSFAMEQGATHLVIGRPIVQADDPTAAATAMLNDMEN